MDITLMAIGESVDQLVLVSMKCCLDLRILKGFRWKILFLGSEFVCPNYNVNVSTTMTQSDATVTNEVTSWSACSYLCRQSKECRYWTWYKQNAGSRANKCATMIYHDDLETNNDAVSGDRNCEGKMINPNFQFLL